MFKEKVVPAERREEFMKRGRNRCSKFRRGDRGEKDQKFPQQKFFVETARENLRNGGQNSGHRGPQLKKVFSNGEYEKGKEQGGGNFAETGHEKLSAAHERHFFLII